jgi:hypothetical protein
MAIAGMANGLILLIATLLSFLWGRLKMPAAEFRIDEKLKIISHQQQQDDEGGVVSSAGSGSC